MIRSVTLYGELRNSSSALNGAPARAEEVASGMGKRGANEEDQTVPPDSPRPPSPASSSFDPRSPTFSSSSFPRPISAPSLPNPKRRYRPFPLANTDADTAENPAALDAATLLPLLEAALDEAESLRAQLAALSSSSTTPSSPTPSSPQPPALPQASPDPADAADLAAALASTRAAEDLASRLRGELSEMLASRDAFRWECKTWKLRWEQVGRERDIARAQLAVRTAQAAGEWGWGGAPPAAGAMGTGRRLSVPTQSTAQRAGSAPPSTAAGKDAPGSEATTAASVAVDDETRELIGWQKERKEMEREWADERAALEGRVERLQAELAVVAAGAAKSTKEDEQPSAEEKLASLTAQIASLSASNASLTARVDELAPAQEELDECVRVLDGLVAEHEATVREKERLEERVRVLEAERVGGSETV